jgi:hypothetical protein
MVSNKKFAGSVIVTKLQKILTSIRNGMRNTRRAVRRTLMEVVGIWKWK